MIRSDYGVVFNNRRIVHPGAYDLIDASGMTVASQGMPNTPVVIGTADAGKPGTLLWFDDPADVEAYLKGGELVTALKLMFSPMPEGGGGCGLVGVIIANQTVQATLTAGGINQTSLEYGEGGNRIQTKLEDGTLAGTKKFTAYKWDSKQLEVFDNLGSTFMLSYTGTQAYSAVTVTVDVDTKKATKLEIKTGADKATALVDVSIDLTKSFHPLHMC
jgi:hypothetical protein